jgi:GNAT superfamily N-acetyltransferase
MNRMRAVKRPAAAPPAPGEFRRLWAADHRQLRDHLMRLEPEDRLLRFGGQINDAQIASYADGFDWGSGAAIGYLVDGELRGLGELKPIAGSQSAAAETALSVERLWQNQGVGTELLRRLIVVARNRSIRTLHMICLLENGKVLRLVRKLGATLTFDQGEVEARFPLPWPNQLTLLLELLDEAGAVLAVLRRAG